MSDELPPLPAPAAFRWAVAKLRGKEWRYTARRTRIDAERLYTEAQMLAAVAAERERCAKVCEAEADICNAQDDDQHAWTLREAAKLIRKG